jgi:hypothetical protein
MDERSPWILFQDAPAVREQMTRRVYEAEEKLPAPAPAAAAGEKAHPLETLEAPEVVQAFIDEEHAETTYHPRYHGLYDHRYLAPGPLAEGIPDVPAEFANAEQLARAHAALYGDDLKAHMEGHQARQKEYALPARLAEGAVQLTGKDFDFRGGRHRAGEAKRLLGTVKDELDQDFGWMEALDGCVFRVHYAMACQVGDSARQELDERYRFHLAVQEIHGMLMAQQRHVQAMLGQLSGKRELTRAEFNATRAALRQAYEALNEGLQAADNLRLPALKNVAPGAALGAMLHSGSVVSPLGGAANSLDGASIGGFLNQLGEVLDKAKRIHFKSLGGILALQEKIAAEWQARQAATEASPEVTSLVQEH